MRIWGAGVIVAAVRAVTGDKKPVTDPFLDGLEYRLEPRLTRLALKPIQT